MDSIDKINFILAKKGMSGADLERKIGVSNSVYSQWNTKVTKPSKKSLAKVADALEVDISDILPDKIVKKEKPAHDVDGPSDRRKYAHSLIDGISEDELEKLMPAIERLFGKNES